jgi:hypothetical protein
MSGPTEAVSFDDVSTRGQELLVCPKHEVRLGLDQQLVALAGRNSHRLKRGTQPSVKDDNPLSHKRKKRPGRYGEA